MVAKYGANLARPALRNHQIALSRAIKLVSVGIQQGELNPKNGFVAEPGLRSVTPGKGVIMIAPVSVCHQVSTIGQRESPTTE